MIGVTRSNTLQVRAERAPFVMLPRWLLYHPEVDAGAKLLYCLLHDLVNGREGPTRPVTRAQLADGLATSVDTVDRRLAQLVAAGAVEKHAQVPSGGQVANVYQVWLTPPDGLRRLTPTEADPHNEAAVETPIPVDNRSRRIAAPVTEPMVDRSRGSAAPPQGCGPGSRTGAAPSVLEEEEQEVPPQPPRTAGGHNEPGNNGHDEDHGTATAGRRTEGSNPRAKGAHPRAAEQAAAAEQERARAARAEADFEARTAARLAEDEAGAAARAAFEAEGLVVSAALDDDRLTRIVDTVRATLTGPLATSALTVTRAVIDWCRTAAAHVPGSAPLPEAVDAALAATPLFANPAESTAPPLPAAEVPAGTQPLRHRVAALLAASVEVP